MTLDQRPFENLNILHLYQAHLKFSLIVFQRLIIVESYMICETESRVALHIANWQFPSNYNIIHIL